jgi:lambda family phage portal protein
MAAGLSFLDRAIGVFAPLAAAQRGLARVAMRDVDALLARRFDAASSKGRAQTWRPTGGSANAENYPALDLIRRRARDMAMNDGWGAQICQKLPAKMIGTGILPRADSKDKAVRERARDAWLSFVENSDPSGQSDFYGQSLLAAATLVRSGEALVRWRIRSKDSGLRVPLQCEVLEPDYLDTRRIEVAQNGNLIIQGVEYDGDGRRVAYWLFPIHPGEVAQISMIGRAGYQSQRVEARFIDHIYRIDRPGQVRGVSWLAPVLLAMRDVADYEEAELVRKKVAACLAFFVKTNGASAQSVAKVVKEQGEDGAKSSRVESVKPGRIHYLDPGQEVDSHDPNQSPMTGYADYLATQLRKAAAGVGMTYEGLSGDLSGVNYSSIREGKLDFWELLDAWQYSMIIPQHSRPAWRRVMQVASLAGLKVASDQRAIFTPPKRPWVDPVKDVEAKMLEMRSGLTSWPEEVAASGDDPEDRIEQITTWHPRLDAAGVSFVLGKGAGANGGNTNEGADNVSGGNANATG